MDWSQEATGVYCQSGASQLIIVLRKKSKQKPVHIHLRWKAILLKTSSREHFPEIDLAKIYRLRYIALTLLMRYVGIRVALTI